MKQEKKLLLSLILKTLFTYNSTYALNFAIKGTIPKDSHIITTSLEHNSVLRPVFYERDENNVQVTIVSPSEDGNIHSEDIIKAMKPETKAVILTHMSNVTGAIIDLLPVTTEARKRNILTIVDVSQSAGFLDINLCLECRELVEYISERELSFLP